MVALNIIGSWCFRTFGSLNLYWINHSIADRALVGYNDTKPSWKLIKYANDGRAYITFGLTIFYMDECMRV